jgi:hypothetical protein
VARIEAERTALYILNHLQQRFPDQWLGGGRSSAQSLPFQLHGMTVTENQKRRIGGIATLAELVEHFSFRSIARDSHLGLLGYLQERYPLILLDHIPQPEEMLEIQCEGKRFVTLLLGEEWQKCQIGRHDGACEFLLHDLEHAHKFFGEPHTYIGQVKFFRKIKAAHQKGYFADALTDPQFQSEFHYLISDMNSHPLHLLKYLKAIVLNALLRRTKQNKIDLDGYWRELFSDWEMSQNETLAALTINLPDRETQDARKIVADFFVQSQIPAPQGSFCLQE